ncbi:helix-turn-helix domain-containing protein [Enterococcus ratti]|uniref:helix-turn-helix domain-containing protein n=1 Tax=Enterococcus ratti TaxID=150033 RepID=UPI003512577C
MKYERNYKIRFNDSEKYEQKYYREITLLLLLEGEMMVEKQDKAYQLSSGDMFVFNINERIELKPLSIKHVVYIELQIDTLFFVMQFPMVFHVQFECIPKSKEQGKLTAMEQMRTQLAELCLLEFGEEIAKKIKENIIFNQLLYGLVQHFSKSQTCFYPFNEQPKLYEILNYIEENFQKSLSLKKVAEHFYLSAPALSKFFKQQTGTYFSDYLRELAINHSLKELLYTKRSIEQIAQNNGFKNSKTYREAFKKKFNVPPTTYRIQHTKEILTKNLDSLSVLRKNEQRKEMVTLLYKYCQNQIEKVHSMNIDVQNKAIDIKMSDRSLKIKERDFVINIGSLDKLAMDSIQKELLVLKKEKMITHVQFHQLFSQCPSSFQLAKKTKLNSFPFFEQLDKILLFLDRHAIGVIFNVNAQQVKELLKESLYRKFFVHLHNQFGKNTIETWKINFNLPPIEQENYLFHELRNYFISISENIEIGATIPLADSREFKEEDIIFFLKTVAPFCQFLTYSADPNKLVSQEKEVVPIKDIQQYLFKKTNYIKHLLKEHELNVPLYLMDWNTITGKTRVTNGTFFRGAIILQEYLELLPLVKGFGFWLNIELYESMSLSAQLLNDGLELFHFQNNKRPVYYCMWLLQRLKGEIIAMGKEYLLVKNRNKYQLLLWNSNYFDPYLSSEESFLNSYKVSLAINIQELPSSYYQIKQIDFDHHNGAVYYTYNQFRKIKHLDVELQEYIERTTHPRMKAFEIELEDRFSYYITLESNAISLIELTAYI